MRVLLIAFRFPPQTGGGVHRPVRFVKHWARSGTDVRVLTTTVAPRRACDPSMLDILPRGIRVERAFDPSPSSLLDRARRRLAGHPSARGLSRLLGYVDWVVENLSLPDSQIGWLLTATYRGLVMCRRWVPDVIVATGPPWTPFLVGCALSRIRRVPLVLDYRDAWMGYFLPGHRTLLQRALSPAIERRVLACASGVVAAHASVIEDLPRLTGGSPLTMETLWVPNGYDRDDFRPTPPPRPECFLLTYAGSLKGQRDPSTFFRVLEELLASGRLDADRVRLCFSGGLRDRFRAHVESLPLLSKSFEYLGHVPHARSVALLEESSVNLIFVRDTEPVNRHTPGKAYEVLYAGRPVLLLCPEGVTTQLAHETGGCQVAHPKDADAIARALIELYDAWRSGSAVAGPDRGALHDYERGHQAERVLSFLLQVTSAERAPRAPRGRTEASGHPRRSG